MTEKTPSNQERETTAAPQGRLPQGHPTNVGTDFVIKGNEAPNLEKRITAGEPEN